MDLCDHKKISQLNDLICSLRCCYILAYFLPCTYGLCKHWTICGGPLAVLVRLMLNYFFSLTQTSFINSLFFLVKKKINAVSNAHHQHGAKNLGQFMSMQMFPKIIFFKKIPLVTLTGHSCSFFCLYTHFQDCTKRIYVALQWKSFPLFTQNGTCLYLSKISLALSQASWRWPEKNPRLCPLTL